VKAAPERCCTVKFLVVSRLEGWSSSMDVGDGDAARGQRRDYWEMTVTATMLEACCCVNRQGPCKHDKA
jgi:hypothetical protein